MTTSRQIQFADLKSLHRLQGGGASRHDLNDSILETYFQKLKATRPYRVAFLLNCERVGCSDARSRTEGPSPCPKVPSSMARTLMSPRRHHRNTSSRLLCPVPAQKRLDIVPGAQSTRCSKLMATFAGMSTVHRIKDCDAMWFRWFQSVAAPNHSRGQVVKLCETRQAPGPASLARPGLFPGLNVPGQNPGDNGLSPRIVSELPRFSPLPPVELPAVAGLPELRFGFDNRAQVGNRFVPSIQSGSRVGPIEIIRRALRFQTRGLLITGHGRVNFPLILL